MQQVVSYDELYRAVSGANPTCVYGFKAARVPLLCNSQVIDGGDAPGIHCEAVEELLHLCFI